MLVVDKHKDQSSNPQHQCLAKIVSSKLSGRPCLKGMKQRAIEEDTCHPPLVSTCANITVHPDTCKKGKKRKNALASGDLHSGVGNTVGTQTFPKTSKSSLQDFLGLSPDSCQGLHPDAQTFLPVIKITQGQCLKTWQRRLPQFLA